LSGSLRQSNETDRGAAPALRPVASRLNRGSSVLSEPFHPRVTLAGRCIERGIERRPLLRGEAGSGALGQDRRMILCRSLLAQNLPFRSRR
jgi:hypothetical protein